MNTTGLIIGIVVVVLLVLIILVVVGLQRRKSKTVSFEKREDDEPKELTQEEKSGNYQAQGGFNFASAKPAEKEPEVLPGQELKSGEPGTPQQAAEAQSPRGTEKPTGDDAAKGTSQGSASDAAAAVKGEETAPGAPEKPTSESPADSTGTVAGAAGAGAAAAAGAGAAAAAGSEQAAEERGDESAADRELADEALAGDFEEAQRGTADDYRVVEEAEPSGDSATGAAPTEDTTPAPAEPDDNYHVVEEAVAEVPGEQADPASGMTEPVEHTEPAKEREDAPVEHDESAETPGAPVYEEVAEDTDVDTDDVAEAEEAAEAAQVTAEGAGAAREQTPVPEAPAEPAPEPAEEIAPAAGRLGRLRGRLSRSQNVIGQGVLGILSAGDLDEDAWEEIEDTLIMADLGTTVTMRVVDSLREKIAERGVASEDEARAMLRETLIEAARPELDRSIKAMPYEGKPAVVLVVGVNGTGKTTTTGKLARVLVSMGHKVLLGAADTFRAAAADQLETWGNRVGATTVHGAEGADPASVAFDAVAKGVEEQADVVLVDTAGRLHTSTPLMDQLGKVKRVVEKKTDVDEVLLVLDATVGQNGLMQARTFREVVDISGVVLTKLDGTAKGGIVFQVQEELGVPVKLVGLGEGADHLAPFEVEGFVDALLG